jgi:hypothetical protein
MFDGNVMTTNVACCRPTLVSRESRKAIRFHRSFFRTSIDSEETDVTCLALSPQQDFPEHVSFSDHRRYDTAEGFLVTIR